MEPDTVGLQTDTVLMEVEASRIVVEVEASAST